MFTSPVFVIIDDFALNVHIISKRTVSTSNKPHTVMVCANSSDLDGKLQRRYRELCTKYFPRSLSMHILRNAIDTSQTKMVKSNTKKAQCEWHVGGRAVQSFSRIKRKQE